jgi:mRNA-degrading endonuclease RelE of RelBE toxin-antitoxin system
MPNARPYSVIYALQTQEHLRVIAPKYHSLIRQQVEQQLPFEPAVPTRNRKPLRQPAPFDAEWEIRFGPDNRFRVLYEVDEANHVVHVLGIGVKDRNRLIFADQEVKP